MEQRSGIRGRVVVGSLLGFIAACSDGAKPVTSPGTANTAPAADVVVTAGEIDMGASAEYTYQGAIFRQSAFETSSGTGLVNPFLKTNTNDAVYNAFNTSGPKPATVITNDDTRDIELSEVPQVILGSTPYREIRLDINESQGQGANFLSLDVFKIHITSTGLVPTDPSNLPVLPLGAALVYDLDAGGDSWLKMDADLSSGSGGGDIFFYIPESAFGSDGASCPYNPTAPCGKYLYLTARFGEHYPNSGGFEEFAVRKLPYASKTAAYKYDESVSWTLDKKIRKSGDATFVDGPVTFDLWNGQSGTAEYQVSVDKTVTKVNNRIEGTITVTNPTNDSYTGVVVTDQFQGTNAVVSCPSSNLDGGATLVCTYVVTLAGPPTLPGTNTALVTIPVSSSVSIGATPTATVAAGSGTLGTTSGFQTINVTDALGAATTNLGSASDDKTFTTYSRTFSCAADRGTKTNTATIVETAVTDQASAVIKCYSLDVQKTADEAQGNTYDWDIAKTVTPATRTMYRGDQGVFQYTVNYTRTLASSAFTVGGTVTVTNPATSDGTVSITKPTDQIIAASGLAAIPVTLDCGAATFPMDLAPGASLQCTYTNVVVPSNADRTNRATVQGTIPTSNAKSYSGDAAISFAGVSASEKYASATISDPNDPSTPRGPFTATGSFQYNVTKSCDADAGKIDNTATLTSAGTPDIVKDAKASITITCVTPTVSKTALTSYRRTWQWDIVKSRGVIDPTTGATAPATLALQAGQSYVYPYAVRVYTTGYANDLAEAHGAITVTGNAGVTGTRSFAVSDQLSGGLTPAVVCAVSTLTGAGVINCTWSQSLGTDIADRTNVATAALANVRYELNGTLTSLGSSTNFSSSSVAVDFKEPMDASVTLRDNCVSVADVAQLKDGTGGALGSPINQSLTGSLCVTFPGNSADQTFNYTTTIGPIANYTASCGSFSFDNTATLTTNTTATTDNSSLTTGITVSCPNACTLTQGYWKTHNASFGKVVRGDRKGPPIHVFPSSSTAWAGWDLWKFFTGTPSPTPTNIAPVVPTQGNPSWYATFWTQPAGNVYYQAAHQFMAATLNVANGAPLAPIDVELGKAYTFFSTYTAKNWPQADASTLLGWNTLFGSYNEGTLGTLHCSEDGTSAP